MDIETHLGLRSFIKPNVNPIYIALMGALFIHILFWVNWSIGYRPDAAAIPEWINVKLVAGFENIENKVEEIKKKEKRINKETAMIKKDSPSEETEHIEETKSSPISPTTFVSADSKPYMLENEKPVYPAIARRRGMYGVVVLNVSVSREGYVENISILKTSGFKILDRSALSSVKGWRFIPAKNGNENISSLMEIPIRFILSDV